MTKEEIRKFLDSTKIYVNGKSKEIQEKLFSFGYIWNGIHPTEVHNIDKPFLFVHKNRHITCVDDMCYFKEHAYREISTEEILSSEVTEPSYRPFENREECWDEMQKHQPFGWIYHKFYESYEVLRLNVSNKTDFKNLFIHYEFPDGTPFGVKDN